MDLRVYHRIAEVIHFSHFDKATWSGQAGEKYNDSSDSLFLKMKARFLYRAYKARYRDQRQEILTALKSLRPGDVAADVGANKGAYLYWLRKAVGTTGQVFAYEPQPSLVRYLESVCAVMHWDNVFVRPHAISDSVGVGTLNVPGVKNSPGASLENVIAGSTSEHSFECPTDTLDNQLQSINRIAFLKVDVEGHELQVFHGAKNILSHHAPDILFECEARHLRRHSMQDVFVFLKDFGYVGAFFSPKGLRPLSEFNPAIHQKQCPDRFWDAPDYCNNFFFTPSSSKGRC